jgi:hypothetical protein
LSNGIVGLRVRENPLMPGMSLVCGFSGEHPIRKVEAAAVAPYPLAGDLQLNGVWLSDASHQAIMGSQTYDFSCAELMSDLQFQVGDARAHIEVVTFCDRVEPTLVCQEISLAFNSACDVAVRANIDATRIDGRALRYMRDTPGEEEAACDGVLLWEGAGAWSTCGLAYATELVGAGYVARDRAALNGSILGTEYRFRARAGRRCRLRQLVSVVPSQMHAQPDYQAVRLVASARRRGFKAIRTGNREIWSDLWRGRIHLVGAPRRMQAWADSALFYLLCSTHTASPASTSIFGLATWHDYHYYYGHVMWDIETFISPVLSLLHPGVSESILDYRFRNLGSAAGNARMRGRQGLQFPWESAPSTGQECTPMPGSASWHEDHVSLDVARAFALHAYVTGDQEFMRDRAWPVLSGVAKWIKSRVERSRRGYEIRSSMGIAERKQFADNPAFTNMSAVVVLRDAVAVAHQLKRQADPAWSQIADNMVLPMRGSVVLSHEGYRANEEKAGTPDPLMGVFPLGYPLTDEVKRATLDFYLNLADNYIGSPMLSALYGVWAAIRGDRALAARLLEDGYGRFCSGRFMQTLEYRADVFPEQPRAGPFFANLGGYLSSLLMGFTGLRPGPGEPAAWAERTVVLPEKWKSIEVDQLWIHGHKARLTASHGAARSILTIS